MFDRIPKFVFQFAQGRICQWFLVVCHLFFGFFCCLGGLQIDNLLVLGQVKLMRFGKEKNEKSDSHAGQEKRNLAQERSNIADTENAGKEGE